MQKSVKKIIGHLIRAIIDTCDIKRAASIFLLESSLHRYSLLSASEYLLEFEKKLSYMLPYIISYIVYEPRFVVSFTTFSLFLRLIFVYEKIDQSNIRVYEILTNNTERMIGRNVNYNINQIIVTILLVFHLYIHIYTRIGIYV